MLSLTLALFLGYLLLIAFYTYQWDRIPIFLPSTPKQQRRFSVLVPARNEADNIEGLLLALQQQEYPSELIEVIVIDDDSTDGTNDILRKFPGIRLIEKNIDRDRPGKKHSIEMGIQAAQHDWILTTDADCIPPTGWIATMNACLDQKEVVCLVGPVSMAASKPSLLQLFQRYDNLMFQGITGAAIGSDFHALGNGANLCYRKEAFADVNGFEGIDQLASGDDVLLVEKFMSCYPGQVRFLKSCEALVYTRPCPSWKALWHQRIRWASKAHAYQSKSLRTAQWITGGFNLVLIVQSIFCILQPQESIAALSIWLLKPWIEWPLLGSVAGCYRERRSLLTYMLLQPIHVIYLVALGLFGRRKTYQWKGRSAR